jgi:hypothetical protein
MGFSKGKKRCSIFAQALEQNMKIRNVLGAALVGASMIAANAATADPSVESTIEVFEAQALLQAAGIGQLMQIVATEGARHGMKLEDTLFPGKGGRAWERVVGAIQAPEHLRDKIGAVLAEELSPRDIATALAYLNEGPGKRIVGREVQVRREMLDAPGAGGMEAVSEHAIELDDTRSALLAELIGSLDLVTANVSSGLNANLAFYRGLADGGAMKKRLTESEMLDMVWSQQDEVRSATETWLEGYLTRAYAPLDDSDLREHIAFASTPSGQRYFSAMFMGFGKVFEETSYDLGRAAAGFIVAEDA